MPRVFVKGGRGSVKSPESAAGFCSKCLTQPKHVTRTSRESPWCRECINAAARDYSARNREKTRKYQREKARVVKYGLTPDLLAAKLAGQGGKCDICGDALSTVLHSRPMLHVDHNHTTEEVRSILCGECNTMIGKAKEIPAILEAGAAYLRRYGCL